MHTYMDVCMHARCIVSQWQPWKQSARPENVIIGFADAAEGPYSIHV